MLTPLQRKDVWDGWIDAEMRAYYFADLCRLYHRRDRFVTWATFVLSSGAAYAIVARMDARFSWVAPTLALGTAVIAGYAVAVQHKQQAIQFSDVSSQWSNLGMAWQSLWESQDREGAAETLAALLRREEEISKVCHSFPVKMRLLAKWQDYAIQQRSDLIKQAA